MLRTKKSLSYAEAEQINNAIKKGEIYYADLNGNFGCEQGGIRPVLVVQNNTGNKYSPTTLVVPITTKGKHDLPTHMIIGVESGLVKDSVVLFEQTKVIDKTRLQSYIGRLLPDKMNTIDNKLKIAFGIA